MSDDPLPMSVIGGYLGAGKTTLINRLLAAKHGKRLMVLVNDFGEINIDAELLESADEDTIALTNGCVCCTLSNDLYMSIADVLVRSPRPDHLIIEASGIADPAKIANAAKAEPLMKYGGIVTVIDALHFPCLIADPLIGKQIEEQISCADILFLSKSDTSPIELTRQLAAINPAAPLLFQDAESCMELLFAEFSQDRAAERASGAHPKYMRWCYEGDAIFDHGSLREAMRKRPRGLFRMKGLVRGPKNQGWLLQVVGKNLSVLPGTPPRQTSIIGIGLACDLTGQECQEWWENINS